LWASFLFIILVAYFTRLLTCGIHELLGHGLWAWIFGAKGVWIYVSWFGFGKCWWEPSNLGSVGNVVTMAGGLINTFVIGVAILAFLFLVRRKGGLYLRSFLFWLAFWATTTQASYLLIGGYSIKSDPWKLYSLTGIPLESFMVLGFGLFLLVYPLLSILFLRDVSKLFPEYSQKTSLFTLWLAMPIQVIMFMIYPEYAISFNLFLLLLVISMIPSLLSLSLFKYFKHIQSSS
jgi:hypothetical protein